MAIEKREGKESVREHQMQPGCGERAAGWRGTGRPNLSCETKFSGVNGDRGKAHFPYSISLTMGWIGAHTVDYQYATCNDRT